MQCWLALPLPPFLEVNIRNQSEASMCVGELLRIYLCAVFLAHWFFNANSRHVAGKKDTSVFQSSSILAQMAVILL